MTLERFRLFEYACGNRTPVENILRANSTSFNLLSILEGIINSFVGTPRS